MVCFPLRLPSDTPGTTHLSTTRINSTDVLERKMAQEHAFQQQSEQPKFPRKKEKTGQNNAQVPPSCISAEANSGLTRI